KIERHRRQLFIHVRGPRAKRREALAVVREAFAVVHELNNLALGKDVFAKVPVQVPGQPDAAFDFEDLETNERNNHDRSFCKGDDKPFSVKELLSGVGPEPSLAKRRDDDGGETQGRAYSAREARRLAIELSGSGAIGEFHYHEREEHHMSDIKVDNKGG